MYIFVSYSLPGSFILPSGSGMLQVRQRKRSSLKMRMTRTWEVDIIPTMLTQPRRLCRGPRHERNSSARSSRHHCCSSLLRGKCYFTLDDCANFPHCLTFLPILVLNGHLYFSFRLNSDTVDYEDSSLIVRYLASMRPFAQSFDIYLSQVRGFIQCEGEIGLRWLSLTFSFSGLSCIDSESAGWECHCGQN